jgi:hypothetical protein
LRVDEYLQNKRFEEEEKDRRELEEMFPFDPDASYYPFTEVMTIIPPKPAMIPFLDFNGLPEYETSEEGEKPEEKQEGFQASLDYINNFYNTQQPDPPLDYSQEPVDDIQLAIHRDQLIRN